MFDHLFSNYCCLSLLSYWHIHVFLQRKKKHKTRASLDIKCAECNDIYIGEASRSPFTRGKEHIKSLAKKERRSALWKHCKEKHNSEMQKFEINVTGSYSYDVMLRQISEGVRIGQVPDGWLMNSKNEWNYFHVPCAVVARDHVK